MPAQTIERIQKREAGISKALADAGEGMDATKRRDKRKSLKRAQRKRRKMVADSARRAVKTDKSAEASE